MMTLDKKKEEQLLKDIRDGTIERLLSERRDDLQLLSPTRVCGILDVTPKTLLGLDIPRVTIMAGSSIRYRASDVAAWINSRTA